MNRNISLMIVLCAVHVAFSQTRAIGQVQYGSPVGTVTAELTVTVSGSGTGSVSSVDGRISACTSSGGTCAAAYNIGSSVTLVPTATGGSAFNWSGGTDGASVCSGSGNCTFNITGTAGVNGIFSTSSAITASPLFSIDLNSSTKFPGSDCVGGSGICPNISFGQGRFWDTPNVEWPYVETCDGDSTPSCFTWTTIDSLLATMNEYSVHSAQVALARTPYWATSTGGYTDVGSCSYLSYSSTGLVTALSESSTTVTATSSFNPGVGAVVVMSGNTPNGYNGVFTVTSSSSTQFQYTNTVSGLGAGTAFGSGCPGTGCAGIPTNLTNSAPGQCDPPVDLARNGTGADAHFRNWVGAYAAHVNTSGYTSTHAHVVDWEIWNEPDTNQFWSSTYGTYNQLVRMEQDAYAIIKGDANFTFTLTSVNGSGIYQGTITNGASNYYYGQHFNITGFTNSDNNLTNAVATASTATSITFSATTTTETHSASAVIVNAFTGETAAQVRATVTSVSSCCNGSSGPADTTSNIVMPSYHASSPALGYGQCYLYTTGTCTNPGGSNISTVPGNVQTDAINFHMKPGQSLESQYSTWVTAIDGILAAHDLAKPLYNTEGGYSSSGWASPYTDVNLQASYIARFYAYSLSLGVDNAVWYDWSTGNAGLGSTDANTAYTQIYTWMVGAAWGSGCTASGTVWTCPLTLANSATAQIMWDTSQTCSPCTFGNQTVSNTFNYYYTTLGGSTATSIVSNTVPVGIQPVLVTSGLI